MKRSAAPSQSGKRAKGFNPPRRTRKTAPAKSNKWRPKFDNVPRGLGTIVGNTTGFPKTLKFKHRYSDIVSLGGASANGVSHKLRCNDLYDPDFTGTGTQPLYFDQLAAVYNHFTVVASKIIVRAVPTGTATEDPYSITLWINDDSSAMPSYPALLQQNAAQTKVCGGLNPSTIYLSTAWSLWDRFKGRVGDSQFRGNASSGPSEQSMYFITLRALDGGISNVTVYLEFDIEYTTVWTELKDIAGS